VSEFIDECRREWKRLRVPDPIADEMAADLAADLQEAEAEGVPPEEVLGRSASDPRAFAASWAAERGVTRPRFRDKIRRRPLLIIASALLAVLLASLIAGVLLVNVSSSQLAAGRGAPPHVTVLAIPDVVGLRHLEAVRDAENAGLGVKVIERTAKYVATDIVVAQMPAGGARVARGSTLVLYVTECSRSVKPPCQHS
jgi:hypothetical protein